MLQEIKNMNGWSHVSFIRATQSLLYVYFQICQLSHENKVHRLKSVTLQSFQRNNRQDKLDNELGREAQKKSHICLMKNSQHKFSNWSFIMMI